MQSPTPSLRRDLMALLRLPVALSCGALALAGAFGAGVSFLSPIPYLTAVASAALFASASLFAASYERAARLRERPHAPVPEDQAPPGMLWRWAWGLLAAGVLLPWTGGQQALLLGIGLALALALHAAWLKDAWGPGFLLFGAAQGLAFLLGLAAGEDGLARYGITALPVALYGIAWEVMRAARQPGAPPSTAFVALVHLVLGASALLFMALTRFPHPAASVPFLVVLLILTFPRFVQAVLLPQPARVLEAVQYGVLSLPMLAASLAAGLGSTGAGILAALLGIPVFHALRRWPVPLVTEPR